MGTGGKVGLVPENIAHSGIPSQIVICTCTILQAQTQLKQTQRMCSNGATASHHSFQVFCPRPTLGEPECRASPKEPCLDSNQGSVNPPPSLWNTYPTTPGKTWPQTSRRQFCSQWNTCGAQGCWWSTIHGGALCFAYGTTPALGLTETSLQSVELSEKTAQWPHFSILTCKWKETLIVCLCHLLPQLPDAEYSLRWH